MPGHRMGVAVILHESANYRLKLRSPGKHDLTFLKPHPMRHSVPDSDRSTLGHRCQAATIGAERYVHNIRFVSSEDNHLVT